jgi:predicted small metal-binding protein
MMESSSGCRDIGMDCDCRACTPTSGEALRRMGEHIQNFHGMKQLPREFHKRASAAIREGSCAVPSECSGGVCRL